jgi:hypothetical protein
MLTITSKSIESQVLPTSEVEQSVQADELEHPACNLSLADYFAAAIQHNKLYFETRQGKRYTSPLFKLVQCLRAHPQLKDCTAAEAWERINTDLKPDWGELFPQVTLPDLEFITAWEQINIPSGESPLLIAEHRVKNEPLTLLHPPTCEGYETYLGIAFHLQRLTPRRNILLPVYPVSGVLTRVIGKNVTPPSISNYSRLARQHGYITLTVEAHHFRGKAAQYRFDLKRFTETGVEVDLVTAQASNGLTHGTHGSQGIQGKHGLHGIQGSEGIEDSSSSSGGEDNLKTNKQEEETEETEQTEHTGVKKKSAGTILAFVKLENTKSQKPIRRSIVSAWQSFMCTNFGWQKPLPDGEFATLVNFAKHTGAFGHLMLIWTLNNWDSFGRKAVGDGAEYPQVPNIPFFHAHEAVAFHLWMAAKATPEEVARFEKARKSAPSGFAILETRYGLKEHAPNESEAVSLLQHHLTVAPAKPASTIPPPTAVASSPFVLPCPAKPLKKVGLTPEEYNAFLEGTDAESAQIIAAAKEREGIPQEEEVRPFLVVG